MDLSAARVAALELYVQQKKKSGRICLAFSIWRFFCVVGLAFAGYGAFAVFQTPWPILTKVGLLVFFGLAAFCAIWGLIEAQFLRDRWYWRQAKAARPLPFFGVDFLHLTGRVLWFYSCRAILFAALFFGYTAPFFLYAGWFFLTFLKSGVVPLLYFILLGFSLVLLAACLHFYVVGADAYFLLDALFFASPASPFFALCRKSRQLTRPYAKEIRQFRRHFMFAEFRALHLLPAYSVRPYILQSTACAQVWLAQTSPQPTVPFAPTRSVPLSRS